VPTHSVGALVAAKAKLLATVAAAATSVGVGAAVVATMTPATTVVTNAAATETASVEPTAAPAPTGEPTVDPAATAAPTAAVTPAYTLPTCPADVRNHGQYVSSVAHSAPKGKGGVHGSWVRQAAQSTCGMPSPGATTQGSAATAGTETPDAADSAEPDAQESPDSDATKPSTSVERGHGHSKH
jgi:hypothetical protein